MKIMVLGGDGYCGWPTSLYFSARDYTVVIVDNFSRRTIEAELECPSLTPIQTMEKRVKRWRRLTHSNFTFKRVDIASNYNGLKDVLRKEKPEIIIHFAKQRAAPYSMKDAAHKLYTVRNNILSTHNVLCALVSLGLDSHLIHLGSTGVYGYGGNEDFLIPEGYIDAVMADRNKNEITRKIMFPPQPGSIYHMTKVIDGIMFQYYSKNDLLRITDLHQGIVWGLETEETSMHNDLINRFDYDGDFGTVLNRFMVQSIAGHPLTVYGTGGQTRAFIHIRDTLRCIDKAVNNPPEKGEGVKIFNQTTEQLNLKQLAERVSSINGTEIRYYKNPRLEMAENILSLDNKKFLELGLNPILVDEKELSSIMESIIPYKDSIIMDKILTTSTWRKDIKPDFEGRQDVEERQDIKKAVGE